MQDHYHAIVWVDHREARIFHVSASDVDRLIVYSHGGGQNLHHKANARDSGHLGNAKTELQRYMTEHRPDRETNLGSLVRRLKQHAGAGPSFEMSSYLGDS